MDALPWIRRTASEASPIVSSFRSLASACCRSSSWEWRIPSGRRTQTGSRRWQRGPWLWRRTPWGERSWPRCWESSSSAPSLSLRRQTLVSNPATTASKWNIARAGQTVQSMELPWTGQPTTSCFLAWTVIFNRENKDLCFYIQVWPIKSHPIRVFWGFWVKGHLKCLSLPFLPFMVFTSRTHCCNLHCQSENADQQRDLLRNLLLRYCFFLDPQSTWPHRTNIFYLISIHLSLSAFLPKQSSKTSSSRYLDCGTISSSFHTFLSIFLSICENVTFTWSCGFLMWKEKYHIVFFVRVIQL